LRETVLGARCVGLEPGIVWSRTYLYAIQSLRLAEVYEMVCVTCGKELAPDARFCPRCGSATLPAQAPPFHAGAFGRYTRVARNLQTLGTLWLVYAALRFVTGIFGVLLLHGIFGEHFNHSEWSMGWGPLGHMGMFGGMGLAALWPIAFFSLLTSVGLVLLTGYALLTRQPWGRVFAIVFSILALFHFPLGTALGIYSLWVLGPGSSGDEYAALAYAQHGS
jgi:ribosomal protein L40E